MSNSRPYEQDGKRRRGIALILVLGILGVMMVLGVSFAISMRAERVAAGHYVETARARHLVQAALARAMWDIEDDLRRWDTEAYPVEWSMEAMPSNFVNTAAPWVGEVAALLPRGVLATCSQLPSRGTNSTAGNAITDWNAAWVENRFKNVLPNSYCVIESPGHLGYIDQQDSGNRSGNGEETLWAKTEPGLGGSRITDWSRGWYRVRQPACPQWTPVKNLGRFAYLIVNVSGLLDANRSGQSAAGAGQPRGVGSSAAQLDLSQLTEIGNQMRASQFVGSRDSYHSSYGPYNTLFDLDAYNSVFGSAADPDHMFPYCRVPAGLDGDIPADISGDPNDLRSHYSEIKEAFERTMNVPGAGILAEMLFANLYDYVDADNVPGSYVTGKSWDGPYVESVPMVNEIFATNTVSALAGGTLNNGRLIVQVEYWYPFVSPANTTFDLVSEARIVTPPAGATITAASPQPQTIPRAPSAGPFRVMRHVFTMSGTNNPAAGFHYQVEVDASVRDGSDVVDQVPTITLDMRVAPFPNGSSGGAGDGHDVVDPRMNWDRLQWQNLGEFTYSNTLGSVNATTVRYMEANTGGCDGDTEMYVANAPLQTVGELGYIFSPGNYLRFPRNLVRNSREAAPWRTIRLYDHGNGEWDPVYDNFSMTNSMVLRGRVNPNSEVLDALATVFYRMPVRKYPGDTSKPLAQQGLSWSQAQGLASFLQNHSYTNQFVKLSDLGDALVFRGMSNAVLNANVSSLEKESLYRNSCDLLHPRQNLFLILMIGETAFDPKKVGFKKADQRAMALVWRDPKPDSDGHHPSFVKWFTWVEK